jgi:regulator of sigma E protease
MILAVLIFAGIGLTTGEQKVPIESIPGIYVADSSLVHDVGFRTGDKPIAVNGDKVNYFRDLTSPTQLTKSTLSYTVLRDGREKSITMPDSLLDQIGERGFLGFTNIIPGKLGDVRSGSPAEEAGLKVGDEIIAINGEPINYWLQLVDKIQSSEGPLQLTVNRDSETFQTEVTPNENKIIGIQLEQNPEVLFEVQKIQYGFIGSIGYGVERTEQTVTGIIQGFGKMFSGDISVRKNLGGPVAIAQFTKDATDRGGWLGFWSFTAFLSVTLAIMNMLPIPVLDGGHVVFLLYEGITRREPSEKVRMALQQIGFFLIIALFIFVTFNDILRQF